MGAIADPLVLKRHRLSVGEYQRMGAAGVFAPDARVELIEGEVIDMAPIGTRHASMVARLTRLLQQAAGERAILWVQNPLRLNERSEPEPDLMLLEPRADFYADAHPSAADVLLLVEVADTSVRYDLEVKLPLYAQHGVREVWIVDLEARLLRFFRAPSAGAYADISTSAATQRIALSAAPSVVVDLSALLD